MDVEIIAEYIFLNNRFYVRWWARSRWWAKKR